MSEPSRNVTLYGIQAEIPDMPEFIYDDGDWYFVLGEVRCIRLAAFNDALRRRKTAVAADVAAQFWWRVQEQHESESLVVFKERARTWERIAERARRKK